MARTWSKIQAVAQNIWHGSMQSPNVQFSVGEVLVQVKTVNFGDVGVHTAAVLTIDASLLISIVAFGELDDFADEDSVGVSRVWACEQSHVGLSIEHAVA